MWKEVYRVLKPGAHLLAFGGSRTYHRLACAIEDAGFQIRDQIMWLYGSGFPKSLDVSKGIDKAAGNYEPGEVLPTSRQVDGPGGYHMKEKRGANPQSDLARQWNGWGTALKPAHEPIVVARKPLEGTVVNNVLKHGCGGINVAGCRIEGPEPHHNYGRTSGENSFCGEGPVSVTPQDGRWPANVIHDGSEEVMAGFPETQSGSLLKHHQKTGGKPPIGTFEIRNRTGEKEFLGSSGSAARFFYCAKASPEERGRINKHPTVKPLSLMAYLVRLVTPPGGVVLDCFMGSGSTLIAAAKEGFDAVGIDLEAENCEITKRRCRGHLGMLAEVKCGFGS